MGMTLSVEGTKQLGWIPASKGTFRNLTYIQLEESCDADHLWIYTQQTNNENYQRLMPTRV